MKHTLMVPMVALATIAIPLKANPTTLDGDHVITGNLDVGTSTAKGNLKVTAPTGTTVAPSLSLTGDGGVIFAG
ncbi:MAG: hypothetical protein ACREKL_02545, partial [Chthoniobacterales bacterium]